MRDGFQSPEEMVPEKSVFNREQQNIHESGQSFDFFIIF